MVDGACYSAGSNSSASCDGDTSGTTSEGLTRFSRRWFLKLGHSKRGARGRDGKGERGDVEGRELRGATRVQASVRIKIVKTKA